MSEKAAQCLAAGEVHRSRDGQGSAVADLPIEAGKHRVRKDGNCGKHQLAITAGTYSARYVT
jgi:hypothetical protein